MIALPPQWRDGRSRHNRRATHFSDKLGAALGTILAVIVIVCLLIATCRSKREGGRTQNSPPTGRPSATFGHGRKVKRSSARPRYSTNSSRTRRDANRKPGRKVHGRTGQGQNSPSRLLDNPEPGTLLSVPLEALQDDTTRATRQIDVHQAVHTNRVGVNPKASGQVRVALSNVAQAPDIAITAPAQLRFSATQTTINLDPIPSEKPSPIKPHLELTETPVTRTNKGKGRKNGNRPAPEIRLGRLSSIQSPPGDLPSSNQVIANQPTFSPPTINQHSLTEPRPPTQSLPNDPSQNEHPPNGLPSNDPMNFVPANPIYPASTNTLSNNLPPTDPLSSHHSPINPLSTNLPTFHPPPPPYPGANLLRTPPTSQSSTTHTLNVQPVYPSAQTTFPPAHIHHPVQAVYSPAHVQPVQATHPPAQMPPVQTVYTPGTIHPTQVASFPQETAEREEDDRFQLELSSLTRSSRVNRYARRVRGKG